MSIEITETIIKRFQLQLSAETMEALITKAPAWGLLVNTISISIEPCHSGHSQA